MLDKFTTSTDINAKGAEHALVLTEVRLSVLLVLDIEVESLAFQEDFEVPVLLENGMRRDLVQHALQRCSSRLDEIGIETTNGLLLRGRRHNHTGVAVMHRVIQPKKVAVPTADEELGLSVCFRRRLQQASVIDSAHFNRASEDNIPWSGLGTQYDY